MPNFSRFTNPMHEPVDRERQAEIEDERGEHRRKIEAEDFAPTQRESIVVKMFKPQFAPLVKSGTKLQTIRPTPKRMPKTGDRISLRTWAGKPYRSKQNILLESIISDVQAVKMTDTGRELIVSVGNKSLSPEELNAFAQSDGFKDGIQMFDWFEETHGLPFSGILIKWRPQWPKGF